jgi:thymidylate synthase
MAFMIDYGDDWRSGYFDLVTRVRENGVTKDSRVGFTREIRDFMFTLSPTAIDLPLGVGRKVNTALAAAEAIQLCAGYGMPDLTEAVSKQVGNYVRDANGVVHGNYGTRVDTQIRDVVDKLRAHHRDRQAVVQIWDKTLDSQHRVPMPKDIPCTLTIVFGCDENGDVTMSVTMRSSDVWLGIPYDVFQFRQLHRTVARLLGRYPGEYCHHSVSMHLYDQDLARSRELAIEDDWEQSGEMPIGLWSPGAQMLRNTMLRVLEGKSNEYDSHAWYHTRLGTAYLMTQADGNPND